MQHVIQTLILPCGLDRQNAVRLLDHADDAGIALGVVADLAPGPARHRDIEAFLAKGRSRLEPPEGIRQIEGNLLGRPEARIGLDLGCLECSEHAASDVERAGVEVDDFFDDGKPETRADPGGFGGEEWFEDARLGRRVHAHAGIHDPQHRVRAGGQRVRPVGRRGLERGGAAVVEAIKADAKEVKGKEEIAQIATISAADAQIGQLIADVMDKVGKDGVITVEEKGKTRLQAFEGTVLARKGGTSAGATFMASRAGANAAKKATSAPAVAPTAASLQVSATGAGRLVVYRALTVAEIRPTVADASARPSATPASTSARM